MTYLLPNYMHPDLMKAQGSELEPIQFNFYINDFHLSIKQTPLYTYADDNTLAYFSKSIPDLVNILEKEPELPDHGWKTMK